MNSSSYLKLSIALITILLVTSSFNFSYVHGSPETKISIVPREITWLSPGDAFTVNITVSDASNIFGWQVAIEYNVTVVNCTAAWLPEDNIFKGKSAVIAPLEFKNFTTYGFIVYGANILGLDTVNVPDVGILCSMNFTVLHAGQTSLRIATRDYPAVPPGAWQMPDGTWIPYEFHTFLQDLEMNEMPFTEESGSIATMGMKSPPFAAFSISPTVLSHENLFLVVDTPYLVNEPILFNASRSYDLDGYIVKYIWDFGDGNITEVDTSVIYHTYRKTYTVVKIKLEVVDNDGISDTKSQSITVGLALRPLDYTPVIATFFGLIVLWIVYATTKHTYKYVKRRKLLKETRGTKHP
ncbi:MAG: PKD domain-containing protein [Candidatus Bathyarchaeota archaeon]|nr:PKD domain-containing protein [Candidatus Bathyarchaeota archaeon]